MNSTTRRSSALALLTLACLAITPATASYAVATPVDTGCPASSEVLTLDELAAQGPYRLPFAIDATGNGDGVVCAMPVNTRAAEQLCPDCPVPVLYRFRDNDLTR